MRWADGGIAITVIRRYNRRRRRVGSGRSPWVDGGDFRGERL